MQIQPRKPPNPDGNPNFKQKWQNLGAGSAVWLPKSLHSLFKDLSNAINSGKITSNYLEAIANGDDNPAKAAIDPTPKLIEKLQQFEDEQKANWGQSPNQRGDFKATSRSWDKFNEFKNWLKSRD